MNQLEQALAAVAKGFTVSPKKCEVGLNSIKFLGYIVSKDGLKPDPSKLAVIKKFKTPDTRKEIESFIGALLYYCQFIPNFFSVAEPLLKLPRQNVESV